VHESLDRWADDELRSTTAQIELLLGRTLSELVAAFERRCHASTSSPTAGNEGAMIHVYAAAAGQRRVVSYVQWTRGKLSDGRNGNPQSVARARYRVAPSWWSRPAVVDTKEEA
jgi:hypothetical protein